MNLITGYWYIFTILVHRLYWSRRVVKNGEGLGTPTCITWMMSGGCVCVGGWGVAVSDYIRIHEGEFLTGEEEYSYECLGSFLTRECSMIKCSAFYECRPLPPTCTSCPPDVIHMVSVPRFPPSFTTPCFHVLYWMHTKEQKQGRPGNETRLIVNCYTIAICIVQPYILYCTLSQQAASVTDMQAKLNKALHYRCPKLL